MDTTLHIEGEDAGEPSIHDLQDWINNERIRGIRVERETTRPAPGEMGAGLTELLTVVGPLATPILVDLVKSSLGWLKMRRSKAKIVLQVGGTSIVVESDSFTNEHDIIDKVAALAKELEG